MFLFLSLFLFNGPALIDLAPVYGEFVSEHPVKISNLGKIYGFTEEHFYLWDQSGNLALTWSPPQGSIWSAIDFKANFLVSYASDNGTDGTVLIDETGQVLSQGDFFAHNLQEFNGRVFGLPVVEEVISNRKFPPLIVEILIGEEISFETSGPMLMPQRLVDLKINFKKSWMLTDQSHVYLINEIEPKAYLLAVENFSDLARIFNLPPKTPFTDIELEGFIPVKELFLPPQGIHLYEKVKNLMAAWWHSFSTIKGFDRFENGFLIAYTVPVCKEEGCFDSNLLIQLFNENFELISNPIRIVEGYYAGVWQNEIHVVEVKSESDNKKTILRPVLRSIDFSQEK